MNHPDVCACGSCAGCVRRAQLALSACVVNLRYRQRRSYNRDDPAERDYVHRQLRTLIAMCGLAEENILPTDELLRSEWGKAMRLRQ